ncbi:putative [histone H3]-lysine(4) N-trimethyltransferase [Helianthus debilis subsp. tardiflorus]
MILQPGQTRMDAALDHICKMGFSRPLVRKTVKDLLKVYGEDGWMLIEEDAYKVLLDYILDEQEAAQTSNLLKDASSSKVASEEVSIQENAIASLTHNAESNKNALSSLNHNAESSEVPLLTMQGILGLLELNILLFNLKIYINHSVLSKYTDGPCSLHFVTKLVPDEQI